MDVHDPHSSFIKTPQQLVVVILLTFLVPIIVIILLVQLATSRPGADPAAHVQAVAGAPKPGDKAAWGPRIQQGTDTLVQSVIKGKGAMPPKAGNPALTDAEIRAAVDFLVSQSK